MFRLLLNALIDKLMLAVLAEIRIKMRYFYWKIANRPALKPLGPLASGGWGFHP